MSGASGSASSTNTNRSITAKGVDGVSLGESPTQVATVLGKPSHTRAFGANGAGRLGIYSDPKLRIGYAPLAGRNQVVGIEVYDPRYSATGGIHVRDRLDRAAATTKGYHCLANGDSPTVQCISGTLSSPGVVLVLRGGKVAYIAVYLLSASQLR